MATVERDAILQRNAAEIVTFLAYIDALPPEAFDAEFSGDSHYRTVADLLGHLHAWHLAREGWSVVAAQGGVPEVPAPGYTWRDLDALNIMLRDKWRGPSIDDLRERLVDSHERLQDAVSAYDDEALADPQYFPWMHGIPFGKYCLMSGANHYVWARELIEAGLADPS